MSEVISSMELFLSSTVVIITLALVFLIRDPTVFEVIPVIVLGGNITV